MVFSKTIKPVCLWGNKDVTLDPFIQKSGLVAGWGKDESTNGLYVLKSKYVNIPIVAQSECMGTNAVTRKTTSQNTFCAGKQFI